MTDLSVRRGRLLASAALVTAAGVMASIALAGCSAASPDAGVVAGNASGAATLGLTTESVSRIVETGWYGVGLGAQVSVSVGDDVVFTGSYGFAGEDPARPVTDATQFGIGSLTKQFTAAAILRLANQGGLALDDTVSSLLPGSGLPPGVTVEQLLEETSGLTDASIEVPAGTPTQQVHAAVVDKVAQAGQVHPPGTVWDYNNNGYYLLGLVLERLTDQPFSALAGAAYAQAGGGQTPTVAAPNACGDQDEVASPYAVQGGRTTKVTVPGYTSSFSAGGLCANTEALLRWQRGLMTGRVVSAKDLALMTTPTTLSEKAGQPTGVPFNISAGPPRVIWEAGIVRSTTHLFGGYSAYLAYLPDSGIGVAVLANTAGTSAGVARTIGELLVANLPNR